MIEETRYTGAGVYAIINATNGKMYIGSSRRVNERICTHRSAMECLRCNEKFKPDVKAGHYFRVEILEKFPTDVTDGELSMAENKYIEKFGTRHTGYNVAIAFCRYESLDEKLIKKAAKSLGFNSANHLVQVAVKKYISEKLGANWIKLNK